MSERKPVLLIDVDGVLTNLNDVPIRSLVDAMQKTAQNRGIAEEEYLEKTDRAKYSKIEPGIFNSVYRLVGKNLEEYELFCTEMFERVDYSNLKSNDKLYELLEKASNSYDIYLATNNHRIHIRNVLMKLFGKKLDEDELCFKAIDVTMTLRDDRLNPKQLLGGLAIYAELAGSEPANCILIDDSAVNLRLAKEIGMKCVEITSYYSLSTFLRELLSK
jgi:FMN phosphatase YigB (HAD superfamily)